MELESNCELIGVGNPIVDLLTHVEDAFLAQIGAEKGGMVLVDGDALATLRASLAGEVMQAPGGSAGNTTFTAARLGLKCAYLGKTGGDPLGAFYRERFAEYGGDTSRFKTGELPNGQCLSLITPDSERTMRTYLGAAMTLAPEDVSVEDFRGCRHAHVEGYLLFNPDLLLKVLRCAKEAGCTVSLDLASFEIVRAAKADLPEILETHVDVVFANEEEAGALLGDHLAYPEQARTLARLCSVAAVKVGKDGAHLAQDDTCVHVPAEPITRLVDTTGAGDQWAAGFLYGWLNGDSLEDAGKLAAKLGAAAVQVLGAELPEESIEPLRKARG